MSKHKNKNRAPKKTFLDAMQEIEPSLAEDNLFSEIYDNAIEIEDVGYADINAAYADVGSDIMTSDMVVLSQVGDRYLVLFDRDDYTSAEAAAENIEFSIFDSKDDAEKKFKEKVAEKKTENIPDYKSAIKNFEKAIQKGLNYVKNHSDKEVAQTILKQFPDTSLNDLESAVKRYREIEAWPETTKFNKESFDHLQDIMIDNGVLQEKVSYDKLMYQTNNK